MFKCIKRKRMISRYQNYIDRTKSLLFRDNYLNYLPHSFFHNTGWDIAQWHIKCHERAIRRIKKLRKEKTSNV